tara:strand:- start:1367 stop:1579 length:213 start_codon:yes stop_codon:yes gene_type:complete
MQLSNQAIGAVMMALQKGLYLAELGKSKEECDITSMIKEFVFSETPAGLVVDNPPILELEEEEGQLDAEV